MRTPPGSTVSHHGVEDHQELPHARYQSHRLLGLAGLNESTVELLDGGIEARSDQGSHVECFSNSCPTAPYGASASQSARVAVERSDPYESRESSLGEREPSSGSSARSVLQSTGPTPGTLLRRASFALPEGGLFSMVSSRSRSVRASS